MADLRRSTLALSFAAMGITSAAFPASIPATAERLAVSPARLLPGVSVLFGSLLAGVMIVLVARHRAASRLLGAGAVLQACALLGLAVAPGIAVFYVACAMAGIGFGLAEASGTAVARRLAAERTTATLAGLNGAAAVSAAACPVIVAAAAPGALLLTLVPLVLVPLATALLAVFGWPASSLGPDQRRAKPRTSGIRQALPGVLPGGALLFLFVGAETVFSGWSSVLPLEVLHLSARTAALGTSAFWALMAAGRYGAAALLRRGVPPGRYLIASLVVASGALAVAAWIGGSAPVARLALAALATASLGPGYALILGQTLGTVGDDAVQQLTGILVAVGSAGGSIIPLIVALGVGAAVPTLLLTQAGLLLACAALAARPGTAPDPARAQGRRGQEPEPGPHPQPEHG